MGTLLDNNEAVWQVILVEIQSFITNEISSMCCEVR